MKKIILWWSGGATSAVACWLAIQFFGKERCVCVMLDTQNEDDDTERFRLDCEKWYGIPIKKSGVVGQGKKHESIRAIWRRYKSLNVAHGAVCSSEAKRYARELFQGDGSWYDQQVFGFEWGKKEMNRALSLKMNHPSAKPIFPLLMMGYDKKDCFDIIQAAGIKLPMAYEYGFHNNNCLKTGCVQGGIGYWQKMKRDRPETYYEMAKEEHYLTSLKGKPVCMLKDQSKAAKESGNELVFLEKHPDYPELKCLDDMPQMEVKPLMECNGFCGVNELSDPKDRTTEKELNYSLDL